LCANLFKIVLIVLPNIVKPTDAAKPLNAMSTEYSGPNSDTKLLKNGITESRVLYAKISIRLNLISPKVDNTFPNLLKMSQPPLESVFSLEISLIHHFLLYNIHMGSDNTL